VEYDPELHEQGETPIEHYTQTTHDDSHGIVAFHPLADRSLIFVTDRGFLYRIEPRKGQKAEISEIGWFHPKGEAYVACLFSFEGKNYLMGLSRRQFHNDNTYEWLVYDLAKRSSTAFPIELPPIPGGPLSGLLLYGSVVRDKLGNCYLGGTGERDRRGWPVLLQVRFSSNKERSQTKAKQGS
jgi:hypothetical protein